MRALLAALFTLLPSLALACPACAAREPPGLASQLVLLSMVVLPFGVAGLAIRAIKRLDEER